MAFSKKHLYPFDDQRISDQAKALAHPARLRVLFDLHQHGKLTVKELAQSHPISEESFSEHLKWLRIAQFITFEERFPYTFYLLQHDNLENAFNQMDTFFRKFRR